MKKILCLMVFLATLMACTKSSGKPITKYISEDSTLVFTFDNDTLFIDEYASGCGIEYYFIDVEFIATNGETIYNGYNEQCKSISIRLSPNPIGTHYDYWIKFDDDKPIPIIKVSP